MGAHVNFAQLSYLPVRASTHPRRTCMHRHRHRQVVYVRVVLLLLLPTWDAYTCRGGIVWQIATFVACIYAAEFIFSYAVIFLKQTHTRHRERQLRVRQTDVVRPSFHSRLKCAVLVAVAAGVGCFRRLCADSALVRRVP